MEMQLQHPEEAQMKRSEPLPQVVGGCTVTELELSEEGLQGAHSPL